MADGLTREVGQLEKLWNDGEIRGAIVLSFFIQILLLITARYRKRNYVLKLKAVSIFIFLLFEYLLADSIAIFALPYLYQNQGQVSHLVILCAPFLLLHLGGQDTITALSIQHNEVWKRHLFTFISQAGFAMYVFAKSWPPSSISWAASFIFITGIIKYVERIWALQKASMSSFKSCSRMNTNNIRNYAKYMYCKYQCKPGNRVTGNSDDVENPPNGITEDYAGVVCSAYEFSQMFKPIFVDSILNYVTWQTSRRYFLRLPAEQAYKVIEVELYFMYDILHTKAAVLHKCYGWCSRIITLIWNVMSFVGVKENWDNFWYTDYIPVESQLKKLVFSELRIKINSIGKEAKYWGFSNHRGPVVRALKDEGCYEGLGWSVDEAFDQTIITWHFATDLLFHYHETDKQKEEENKENNDPSYRDISEHISKYMLFLLIVRPFMIPTGFSQIRLSDTCEPTKTLLQRTQTTPHNLKEASIQILNMGKEYTKRPKFVDFRGSLSGGTFIFDLGRSILSDVVKLAEQLQELFQIEEANTNIDRMWKLISVVWVEMLCFAASKCGGNSHMKQLSMGGEFLTHVCFLMAHLGVGEDYRFGDYVEILE
ncbi:hypothetical protein LUZ60_012255 [Juncus effusus]|nr:hypothetical protein LUZ60_012255 [Juncus effusus]